MADQPTPQQIEALATPDDDSSSAAPTAADLLGVSAFYGNPKIQGSKGRQASADSNQQAAMLGPSLVRGAIAGTVGIPGDMEYLFKTLENHYHGTPDATIDTTLPTTSDLNNSLPGKTDGGMNNLATGVGNLVGPSAIGDVVKGVGAVAKFATPKLGDVLDAYHTTIGGKANILPDDMIKQLQQQANPSNIVWWMKNKGQNTPLDHYITEELGINPDLTELINQASKYTKTTGNELGVELPLRGDVRRAWTEGDDSSVSIPSRPNNGKSILNIHTHPSDSLPFPSSRGNSASGSDGDIGFWSADAARVNPDGTYTGLVVKPNVANDSGLTYSSRTLPGQSPILDPDIFNPTSSAVRIAATDGAYDPVIRDALEQAGRPFNSEMMDRGRRVVRASASHLPMAYFDANGLSSSAQYLNGFSKILMPGAWSKTRDILENAQKIKVPGYAAGGTIQGATIGGPQTVGLAQFAGANDVGGGATGISSGGQRGDPTGYMSGIGSSGVSSAPAASSSDSGYYGDQNSFWNNVGGGSLPQPISNSSAPTFNENTQFGHDFLSNTINAMGHKGGYLQGADALIGYYTPYTPAQSEGASEAAPSIGSGTWNSSQLINGAKQFGIDLSKYDLDPTHQSLGFRSGIGPGVPITPGVPHPTNGQGGIEDAIADFDSQAKNYRALAGASAGWDGSGNARSGSRELYQVQPDGTWLPVNQPVPYAIPKTGSWAHQNADLVSAIGVMLPAVGGWAGLLGQTGATAGLTGGALTAANAGINALGSAAMGGNPITGLAGAAGGYLGGLAGLSPTLGSMAGSQLAKYFMTPSASSPASSAAIATPVPTPVVNTPQTLPNIGSYFTTPAKSPT